MDNKYILFDRNSTLVDYFRNQFSQFPNFEFQDVDVRNLLRDEDLFAIVSPANSMGYMDGGIDLFYMRAMPDIQSKVMSQIQKYGIKSGMTSRREKFANPNISVLPVGSAFLIDAGHDKCMNLICAPTMPIPCPITDHEEYVYYAFLAVLEVMKNFKGKTVAIPGLGTACGRIKEKRCAELMKQAYCDFRDGTIKGERNVKYNAIGQYILTDNAEFIE